MKKVLHYCCSIIILLVIPLQQTVAQSTNESPANTDTHDSSVSDDSLMTLVQYHTFQYFWDGAEPASGLARERFHEDDIYPQDDKNVVTIGGSGFGVMAILVGIERGFITRQQGLSRLQQIISFLEMADRFHGAWPHWLNGETGKVKPFSKKDNGGDLVETAFLVQGLLCVRQYFIAPEVYHQGWARNGNIRSDSSYYGYELVLDHYEHDDAPVGPLFWAHYSYLGLDPRGLSDRYGEYWKLNQNHALTHLAYCVDNPKNYVGYGDDCWGLTSSYSMKGYAGHRPGNDLGVISPTAALSSIPYTSEASLRAMRHFYTDLNKYIWGDYGFYDAFSETRGYYPPRYLAIDQGPIVVMIENYRSGLLWELFMSCPEVQQGLDVLDFSVGEASEVRK